MPGLAGFTRVSADDQRDLRLLEQMRERLRHAPFYRSDALVCAPHLCATRCVAGRLQPAPQPHTGAGLRIWVDGEMYNRAEVAPGATSDPHLLELLYLRCFPECLARLDGLYAAVVYDETAGKLHLVTDRYGLRPLYWARRPQGIAWASEVKALLCLPDLAPHLDAVALESFLGTGYLHEDLTWFSAVRRVPAGSLLTWNLQHGTCRLRRYWTWSRLPAPDEETSPADLADELAGLFVAAVRRRVRPGEEAALFLSGGLDSRAILAALPAGAQVHAITFGPAGSADARIAARCARVKGVPHHLVGMDASSWLEPRLPAVWWTDGMLDLLHMHGVEAMPKVREVASVLLNGAGGDGLAGGGHLFASQAFPGYLQDRLGLWPRQHPELVAALQASFSRLGSSHAFYVDHRMRSFSVYGLLLGTCHGADYRLPFMDNAFEERLHRVPVRLRLGNALYRAMLLRAFPAFYRRIPWQASGAPLSWPPGAARLLRGGRRLIGRRPQGVVDYPGWLRQEPARTIGAQILLASGAIYPDFVARSQVIRAWTEHQSGADRTVLLGRYLTFEVLLQQFLQGNWRPPQDSGA